MTERNEGRDGPGVAPAGFRLPGDLTLDRVVLQVSDVGRSAAWYGSVLGLTPAGAAPSRGTGDGPGPVELVSADGAVLVELRERSGARPVPPGGRPGLYHYAILLPDRGSLGRYVRHLTEQGVRFGASDHRVSEALYLHDPDGLGIEVYADRPQSEWRRRNGELVMATEPLDLNSLVSAAGDTAWTGMPAGTRMGHVHLHVGDIAEAAAFYEDALGFDRTVWSYPGALFMSAGGYHHHLGVNTWAAHRTAAGDDDARLLEWRIVLPETADVAALAAHVEAAGYAADRDDRGGDLVLADPWRTRVRIRGRA